MAEGNPEDPWVVVGTSWRFAASLAFELVAMLAFALLLLSHRVEVLAC